jgi:RimJ/RimL family protein N-acetyltransferase
MPMTPEFAADVLADRRPLVPAVAADYPTELSRGVAQQAQLASDLGPYLAVATDDDVVVGEIGGALTGPGVVEIGYAIVPSRWGRGLATAAVRELVERLRARADIECIVAHTPLDRPASARVLEKAGFACVGEADDLHEGTPLRVKAWELRFVRA